MELHYAVSRLRTVNRNHFGKKKQACPIVGHHLSVLTQPREASVRRVDTQETLGGFLENGGLSFRTRVYEKTSCTWGLWQIWQQEGALGCRLKGKALVREWELVIK